MGKSNLSSISKEGSPRKSKKSISGSLLKILLPVTTVAIVFIIIFLSNQAQDNIETSSKQELLEETEYNASDMSKDLTYMLGSADTYASAISKVPFADSTAMQQYLATAKGIYSLADGGVYVGFEDKSTVFSNGYIPDADFDCTQRDWYKDATDTFTGGTPYMDVVTNSMCVTFSKKLTAYDGRTGVMGIDVYLNKLVKTTAKLKPLGTGTSLLISGDTIISFPQSKKLDGKSISKSGNSFLTSVKSLASSGQSKLGQAKINGKSYFVAVATVPNTNWTLVSSVGEADVLAEVTRFKAISFALMVITILAIAAIILYSINKIVARPVKTLAAQISEIAKGNFTVNISKGSDNEIGLIQDEMMSYINVMRSTIGNIQNTSKKLSDEANHSRDASSKLHTQANEQSISMGQIRETMDGMSSAVSELANNATLLAQSVSDLTDEGKRTNDTMRELVTKAGDGHKDMAAVESNMLNISTAMTDMNDVVTKVDDSAKEITNIIELINSIAEQTNLLSLNASIEAARAGEAGKGFAVVASEIAKLANDSGNAAKEIANIINEITSQIASLSQKSQDNMGAIKESSSVVTTAGTTFETIFNDLNETGKTMENMLSMMTNIDDIASSVAAISEEQSASSEEVVATTENLAESASKVSEESEGVDRSASTVSGSADSIGESLRKFQI
jgi:methyl-accepting chemotaxis protein